MNKLYTLLKKPLGEILQEAGLISSAQLKLALMNQSEMEGAPEFRLRLGEILALRGWIKKETADFFVEELPEILSEQDQKRLGEYLLASALLEKEQVQAILAEQEKNGLKFGSLAVLKGWLKQPTIDFFLEYFASGNKGISYLEKQTTLNGKATQIQLETLIDAKITQVQEEEF